MCRFRLIAVAALVALVSMSARSAQADVVVGPFSNLGSWTLVSNGDFSSNLTGWSLIAGGGSFSQVAALGPDGVPGAALATNYSDISGAGYAEQTGVSVTAGVEYVLSGFVKLGTASGNAYLDLNDTPFDPNILAQPGVADWQFVYQKFTPTTNALTVRLVRDVGSRNGDQVLFDKIAITPATQFTAAATTASAVPLPSAGLSTFVLLAAAGVARVARKFRKA